MSERKLTPIYIDVCPVCDAEVKGVFLRSSGALQICPNCEKEYPVKFKEYEKS